MSSFKVSYMWHKKKKGKKLRVVLEDKYLYQSNKEFKKRYNSKLAKTNWSGKNFNKRRINER